MKKIDLYQCEHCKTQYNSKDKALECEKSHRHPKKIEKSIWIPMKDNKRGYPTRISVLMDDGEIVTYKR